MKVHQMQINWSSNRSCDSIQWLLGTNTSQNVTDPRNSTFICRSLHGKKKLGGRNNFAQHKQKLPDFICLKNCALDITTCSLCAYSKGILLVCALQNQNYPFETNKPDPDFRVKIAQLSPPACAACGSLPQGPSTEFSRE